jgi:predicted dithiol-disulfide oxidoreductase (DUF899 family)
LLTCQQVTTQSEWLQARKSLLEKEKELTRARDALAKERQSLPMYPVTKSYQFTSSSGPVNLSDLFEGRRQLIIYHFMLGPESTEGCPNCSYFGDHVPDLSHLNARNTTFAVVSRAPIETIEKFKKRMGWTFPWYSSYDSDFNFDFHVTNDKETAPVEYNYQNEEELDRKGLSYHKAGEQPGISCFLMGKMGEGNEEEGQIYHTYSAYARGMDHITMTFGLLDMTKMGRQDEKVGVLFKHHDKYTKDDLSGKPWSVFIPPKLQKA